MLRMKEDTFGRHFIKAGKSDDAYYYSVQEKDDYDEYEEDEFV